MKRTINDFTDAELAAMIRNSVYVQGTRFGNEETSAQWLIVLAIPYGKDDTVQSLPEAFEAFVTFAHDYDWQERNFQVYDVLTNQFRNVQMETEEN